MNLSGGRGGEGRETRKGREVEGREMGRETEEGVEMPCVQQRTPTVQVH